MTEKEIIKALKDNTTPFDLMPEELQRKANEIGADEFEFYSNDSEWLRTYSFKPKSFTYRLRPDYKPEPEVTSHNIQCPCCGMLFNAVYKKTNKN